MRNLISIFVTAIFLSITACKGSKEPEEKKEESAVTETSSKESGVVDTTSKETVVADTTSKEKVMADTTSKQPAAGTLKKVYFPLVCVVNSSLCFPNKDGTPEYFKRGGGLPFKTYVTNDTLYFNGIIYDVTTGKRVVHIYGQRFLDLQSGFDYNHDKHGLEVVNSDKTVLFQFYLNNKNQIAYLGGYIRGAADERSGWYFSPNDDINKVQLLTKGVDVRADSVFVLPTNKLTRIFKYPSQKYLGVRESR